MTVGAVVLYSVDGLLSKDNCMSAIVVTVILIDVTEFHFRIIAHWSILQNVMDRAVDILLPGRVILETIYCIIYVLLNASLFFCKISYGQGNYICVPILTVTTIITHKDFLSISVTWMLIRLL